MVPKAICDNISYLCSIVLHNHTQPTMKKGSGQPTVVALVKSLARFLAILVNC